MPLREPMCRHNPRSILGFASSYRTIRAVVGTENGSIKRRTDLGSYHMDR